MQAVGTKCMFSIGKPMRTPESKVKEAGWQEGYRLREVELRFRMVATSMIMGRTFSQFDNRRKVALRDNWGRVVLEPGRIADGYKPEPFGPKRSGN